MYTLVCIHSRLVPSTRSYLKKVLSAISSNNEYKIIKEETYINDEGCTYKVLSYNSPQAGRLLNDIGMTEGFCCMPFGDIEDIRAYAFNHDLKYENSSHSVTAILDRKVNSILSMIGVDVTYKDIKSYLPEQTDQLDSEALEKCVRTAAEMLRKGKL